MQRKTAKYIITMSEIALEGLLFRLKGTLSLDNRQWLAEHLIEPANEASTPYTIEELQSRAENGVQQIKAGNFYTTTECAQRREDLIRQFAL